MQTAATHIRAAVRKQFASDMTRLGLWYVHHLLSTGRITRTQLPDALTRRVNIYRLTTLWDGEHDPASGHHDSRWLELAEQLAEWLHDAELEVAEQRALGLLDPLLATEQRHRTDRTFGCWWYRAVGEGIADRPGVVGRVTNARKLWHKARGLLGAPAPLRHAELHLFNACTPRSPLKAPHELLRSLVDLVADCQSRHPTVQRMWCSSWLNDRDAFVDLFPNSWRASASPRSFEDVDRSTIGRARLNTYNWWGQFERSDGSFNERLAARFRASGGVLPFANRLCSIAVSELREHIDKRLSQEAPAC